MTAEPTSTADLKRAVEDGRAFRVEAGGGTTYLHFAEDVRPIKTETWLDENLFTGPAGDDDLCVPLQEGAEQIDSAELPTSVTALNQPDR